MDNKKFAIIIGAGPAGLTAAYELITRTNIIPIIYEATNDIGGIARTINYKGNRIDIGGHRFFSKSDRVMNWWENIFPLQNAPSKDEIELKISYHNKSKLIKLDVNGADPEKTDKVLLIRNRLSRIFFLRKFFNYPISLTLDTIKNLGLFRMMKIGCSYIKAKLLPIHIEKSLEDFFINRFGNELYRTFFKDYTEKVWGVPCKAIPPEWGAQRIKGLSITSAILHALKKLLPQPKHISQKDTETSLIEHFLYPKFGPGQIWEEVATILERKNVKVHMHHSIIGLTLEENKICEVTIKDENTGKVFVQKADYFFSTMPVKDLITNMKGNIPDNVKNVGKNLEYRDFITVGVLVKKLKINNHTQNKTINNIIPDNWIYIQEKDVKLGRLQIFNNWSPYMVKDKNTVWMGLEYFCNEGDSLWSMDDNTFKDFAIDELEKIGLITKEDVLDGVVIRVPKTYPAYFGAYNQFHIVRDFTNSIDNLFLIGRNGMHRYNNQDHSMLTAMTAVDNLVNGISDKNNIWEVNTEEDYHESK